MPVAITIDTHQMAKMVSTLGHIKDGVPKAMAPAINRALASGRTVVKREIRKEYTIKAKDIPVAVHNASRGSLSGEVSISQGMLGLDKFNVRPRGVQHGKKRKPLFVQVKKGGGGTIPHAFFIPQGGPYSRIGPSRFPILKLATIGAAIMASQPHVGPEVNRVMGETLAKRMDHEMGRVLASAGGHS
jgi:hypothetical protein